MTVLRQRVLEVASVVPRTSDSPPPPPDPVTPVKGRRERGQRRRSAPNARGRTARGSHEFPRTSLPLRSEKRGSREAPPDLVSQRCVRFDTLLPLARPSRPSEPILLPKLRIHFADFPYLHYSVDQRLLTLETCCGHEYGRTARLTCPRRGFQGPTRVLRTQPCLTATLFGQASPFSGRTVSRANLTLKRGVGSLRCSRQRPPFWLRHRSAPFAGT